MKRWLPWILVGGLVFAIGRVRFVDGRVWFRLTDRKVIPGPYPISEEAQWIPLDDPSRRYFESGTGFAPYV